MHTCGTCGDPSLIIRTDDGHPWRVFCGGEGGHEWRPVRGTSHVIKGRNVVLEDDSDYVHREMI